MRLRRRNKCPDPNSVRAPRQTNHRPVIRPSTRSAEVNRRARGRRDPPLGVYRDLGDENRTTVRADSHTSCCKRWVWVSAGQVAAGGVALKHYSFVATRRKRGLKFENVPGNYHLIRSRRRCTIANRRTPVIGRN